MQDIIKKLRFKESGVIFNAPKPIEKEFVALGFKTAFVENSKSTNTLVFVNNQKEYLNFLTNNLKYILPDSLLWIAYPKGTSKVKTDINRDSIRIIGEEFHIKTVSIISFNDTWSCLRFRPMD